MPAGFDIGHGSDPTPVVRRLVSPKDDALVAARAAGLQVLEGRYVVQKYWGDPQEGRLYEVVESAPNLFLTAGISEVLRRAGELSSTGYGATNCRLAVGDGTTAAAAGQTDLVGTNKYRQLVDAAPTVTTNSITWIATFAQGVANFDWREVGVVNAASGGAMWSRTVINLGTKSSAASWVLNWSLSIS